MACNSSFNVFVSGTTGTFTGCWIRKKCCITEHMQSLSNTKNDPITAMSWEDDKEKRILLACDSKSSKSVKIFNTESRAITSEFSHTSEDKINGIVKYGDDILISMNSGHIEKWNKHEKHLIVNAGPNLSRMRPCPCNKEIVATGGIENRLKLFNIEQKKQVFSAKFLPHDSLELKVPISISDLCFLKNEHQIVTVERHGHARLYDTQQQRRPVSSFTVDGESLTCVTRGPQETQVLVGSTKGRMKLVDLRKPCKVLKTYKGPVGSIRSIFCNPPSSYIVSCSLDRYVYVHDRSTAKLLKKIYVKSKISNMVARSTFSLNGAETDDEDEDEEEENSIPMLKKR